MGCCLHGRGKDDEEELGPSLNNSEGQISKVVNVVDECPADPLREENLINVRTNFSNQIRKNSCNKYFSMEPSVSLQPSSRSMISSAALSASCTSMSCGSFLFGDNREIISFDGCNTRACDRHEFVVNQIKAQMHYGMNPNVFTTHGDRTCLMVAVMAGDLLFVKQLVELGVNVNKKSQIGETALSLAKDKERNDIANYLRSKGAMEIKEID